MNGAAVLVVLARLEELAADVGRLRRRRDTSGTGARLALDRIAGHVESIDGMVFPSAGELAVWASPGDDEAAAAALELVDARRRMIRGLLREREP